jgi:hypothetical protein
MFAVAITIAKAFKARSGSKFKYRQKRSKMKSRNLPANKAKKRVMEQKLKTSRQGKV